MIVPIGIKKRFNGSYILFSEKSLWFNLGFTFLLNFWILPVFVVVFCQRFDVMSY